MDKKFTIAVDAKVAPSVQQMSKMLDDLASRGNKVAKAFSGLGAGAGAGSFKQGALAKALLEEKKLFDDLGKSGEKLAKILNEQVGKSQQALTKNLEASTKGLELLVKKHEFAVNRVERLKREGADPSRIALAESYAGRAAHAAVTGAAEQQSAAAALSGIGGPGGAEPGGAGGGGFARMLVGMLMGRAGVPMGGLLAGLGTAGLVVGGVAAAGMLAYKGINAVHKGNIGNEAEAGDVGASMLQRGLSGDARYLTGRALTLENPENTKDITGLRSFVNDSMSAVGSSLQLFNGVDNYVKAYNTSRQSGYQQMLMDRYNEKGSALGPIADIQNFRLQNADTVRMMRQRFGALSFDRSALAAADYNIDAGEFRGYMGSLAPAVGVRSAERYAHSVAQAQAAGMDPGQALGIIGRGASTGSDLLAPTAGYDATVRGIAGDAAASGLGPASTLYQGKGMAMAGILANASTGAGALGVMQAQQAVGGAAGYGALFGGHDPFQRSYNIAAATAALGNGSDPYQRQFLASSMKDPAILSSVLKGQLPSQFESMGIKLPQAQAFARDVDKGATGSRWMDMGGDYEAAKYMREINKAGGKLAWTEGMRKSGLPSSEIDRRIRAVSPLDAQVQHSLTGGEAGVSEELSRFGVGVAAGGKKAARRAKGVSAEEDAEVDLLRLKQDLRKKDAEMYNEGAIAYKAATKETILLTDAIRKARESVKTLGPDLSRPPPVPSGKR